MKCVGVEKHSHYVYSCPMTDSSDLYFFYPSNMQPLVLYPMLLDLNECGAVYI